MKALNSKEYRESMMQYIQNLENERKGADALIGEAGKDFTKDNSY